MDKWQFITEPVITDALLCNPGIGFIAAPRLEEDAEHVYDNRGNEVAKYKFAPDQKTWNHPDSGLGYAGSAWNVLEPAEGTYNWEPLDEKLEAARAAGK